MNDATGVADKVKAPAIGLLIVGLLGALAGVFGILNSLLGLGIGMASLEEMRKQGEEIPEWVAPLVGGGSMAIQVISNLVGVAGAGFVVYGALKMQKLQNRTLAMIASVIAMIPCLSPCCCIGIPIGIWALVVLNKDDVKAAFTS
jgi:hypothetical protein